MKTCERILQCITIFFILGCAAQLSHAGQIVIRTERNDALPAIDKWHYRTAIPFPENTLKLDDSIELRDGNRPFPCEFTTLSTWSPIDVGKEAPPELIKKTGIRWLGLDFTGPVKPGGQQFKLQWGTFGKDWGPAQTQTALNVTETDSTIAVDNGLIRFTVKKQGFNFIDSLSADGQEIIRPGSGLGAYSTKADGTVCWSAYYDKAEVTVEVAGPMLTVIRAEGWHWDKAEGGRMKDKGGRPAHSFAGEAGRRNAEGKSGEEKERDRGFCKYVVRICAYADVPYVKVQHPWINTEDTEQTRFGAFGLFVPRPGPDRSWGGHMTLETPQ